MVKLLYECLLSCDKDYDCMRTGPCYQYHKKYGHCNTEFVVTPEEYTEPTTPPEVTTTTEPATTEVCHYVLYLSVIITVRAISTSLWYMINSLCYVVRSLTGLSLYLEPPHTTYTVLK